MRDLALRTDPDAARGTLRKAVVAAAEGGGGCMVIEGPGGIGKSRLLDAAAAEASEQGIAVAAGQAAELDRVAPLTTLMTSLRATPPPGLDLAGLVTSEHRPLWLVDRLRKLIEDYVRAQTLIIVVDDAHWSDELSTFALRMLIPALSLSPVLWLLARRTDQTGPAQDTLDWLISEGATRLHLAPLADDAIATLCADILGAAPDDSVLRLAGGARGNPLLLTELLTTLRESGQIRVTAGTATLLTAKLPSDFLSTVDWRLRDLPPEVRRLLESGSILARPFTLHEAAGLMERSAVDLVSVAEKAVDSGILEDTGSELAFRHDLIREAVYAGLSAPVRTALHREAADVVQAEGRSTVEATEHLIRGGGSGTDRALAVLDQAVQRLTPNAPSTAADLILRMLRLLDSRHTSRPQLTADAVRLLASAGRITEARELGDRELRAGLAAETEADLLLGMAEALKHAGRNAKVVDYTRRALSRRELPDSLRAQLLAVQAHGLLYTEEVSAAEGAGAEAVAIGTDVGEHSAVVFGNAACSTASRVRGKLDDAVAYAHEAVRVAETVRGEVSHRHPQLWLGVSLTAMDLFAEADAVYEMGQREAEQLGTAWSQPLWHYYRSVLRVAAGRLGDAEAEAEAGVQVAEQLTALALNVPLLSTLAHVAVLRGEMESARGHLDRAQQLVSEGISVGPEDLAWTVASYHDACGKSGKALDTLADVYANLSQRPLLLTQHPQAAAELVRIARRNGATDKAERAAAAARRLAQRNPAVASLAGAAAHAEGLLKGRLETLRGAVEAYQSSPRPLARARALEDAAFAENTAGHRTAALALLDKALHDYEISGAFQGAARVDKQLHTLDARGKSGQRRPSRATARDRVQDSLTDSEIRVARLVADGLTNREVAGRLFLSPHTVDSHLRHSFTKLGVSSRVELTRYVLEHDIENHAKT